MKRRKSSKKVKIIPVEVIDPFLEGYSTIDKDGIETVYDIHGNPIKKYSGGVEVK